MKRKKYIAPQTDVSEVELESGFMSASAIEEKSEVKSNSQEIEREYTFGEDNDEFWK